MNDHCKETEAGNVLSTSTLCLQTFLHVIDPPDRLLAGDSALFGALCESPRCFINRTLIITDFHALILRFNSHATT